MRAINKDSAARGFTLVEMAVVVLILGILTVAFSQVYAQRVQWLRANETAQDVKHAVSSIAAFRGQNGRYPCPASLSLTATNPAYGRESDCADETTIGFGQCVNGVCVQQSARSVQYSSGGANFDQQVRIRVGSLPFRQLNIPEDKSIDGYGNRITYVVTERLAVSDRFSPDDGGISINDDNNITRIQPASSAHFMIFSHGKNGNGAYTRDGVLMACNQDSREGANCAISCSEAADGGTSCTVVNQGIYRASERSEAGTAAQFDDVVNYFTEDEIPLWQASADNPDNMHQKPTGSVGFNTPADFDLQGQRARVSGDMIIRDDPADPDVEQGKAMVDQVCTADGTRCFALTKITGTKNIANPDAGSLACAPGQYMVGVGGNRATCVPIVTAQVRCPAGEFMLGVDPDGDLLCSGSSQICNTQSFGICGTTASVASAIDGETRSITVGSRTENYMCNNGNWVATTTVGECDCVPAVIRTNANVACGTGYTGRTTSQVVRTCPAGTEETRVNYTPCTCVARAAQNRTQACPAGQTGIINQTRTWSCPQPNRGAWSAWTTVSNTCACTIGQTQTRQVDCPYDADRHITQTRRITRCTPSVQYSAWTETENLCRCNPDPERRTINCPAGYDGGINQQRVYNCASATMSAWTEVSRNCTPTPPKVCNWNRTSSSNPSRFGIGNAVGSACTCGSTPGPCFQRLGADDYVNFTNCACD